MFQDIQKERLQRYHDAGLKKTFQRTQPSLFFNQFQNWWSPVGNVTFLSPFESAEDFQNDVKALFIKPLTCYALSWYHTYNWMYELALAVINLVTLDFTEAGEHLYKCFVSLLSIIVYDFLVSYEILANVMSLAVRTLMSFGAGVYLAAAYLSGNGGPGAPGGPGSPPGGANAPILTATNGPRHHHQQQQYTSARQQGNHQQTPLRNGLTSSSSAGGSTQQQRQRVQQHWSRVLPQQTAQGSQYDSDGEEYDDSRSRSYSNT